MVGCSFQVPRPGVDWPRWRTAPLHCRTITSANTTVMANPRKFSEKIALHNQKQAEETAAFEQIMREVNNATRVPIQTEQSVTHQPDDWQRHALKLRSENPDVNAMHWFETKTDGAAFSQKHHLHINHQALGSYRGGSLPNVNQIGNNSVDLQNALNSLEEIKQGRECVVDRGGGGMYRESRSRHVTSIRARAFDKRVDTSPYGSLYLSPPPDTSWRRTNSDSALHQSAMNPPENYHNSAPLPDIRRVPDDGTIFFDGNSSRLYSDGKKQILLPPSYSRPKSCEVPGINIYHSEQEPGVVHIPIANNTGSLPDLTNLQFPSPLATPLDVEDQNTPPYTSSPATLSPTSLTTHLNTVGIIQQPSCVTNASMGGTVSQTPSTASPSSSRRRLHHNLNNLVIAVNPISQGSPHQQAQGLAVEAQGLPLDPYSQSSQYSMYQHPQLPPQPHQQHAQQQQQQSPALGISSPSSLPSQSHMSGYRSGSPAETSCSAPQSPVSQSLSPSSSPGLGGSPKTHYTESNYYLPSQTQAITASTVQQSFEQFNLIDSAPVSTSVNRVYMTSGNCLHYSQAQNAGLVDGRDLLDSNYYAAQTVASLSSYSHSVSSPVSGQPQQSTPQTPQTPSSIPDIILTDFSTCHGADDAISRHDLVKDIGMAMAGMSGAFDSDLFPTDDALKAGLDPIDFDGLQILTDPDIVTDAATEDSFRLDRL